VPSRTKSSTVFCVVAALGLLAAPSSADAQSSTALQICAKRAGKAFKRFGEDALEVLGDCEVDSLKDDERNDCAAEEDVWDDLDKAADKLRREVKKCNDDALRGLCPHGQKEDTTLKEQVLHGPGGTTERLRALDANLFSTSYALCPRPLGEISSQAEDCADRIAKVMVDGIDEYLKCVVKCELTGMRKSGSEPCVNELNGEPLDNKVLDCVERVLDDIDDGLHQRCDDALIVDLGCPLGKTTVGGFVDDVWTDGVVPALSDRLYDETVEITRGIFDSECSESGGSTPVGGPTDPAPATLYPSLTVTQVECGQVLDSAFFGSDNDLKLDANLDCSPAGRDSNGLVVAASNVIIDGRTDHDITGPARSSNRTGTGILIAPGTNNVIIRRFRAIQRYGVGIGDSGNNDGLRIEELTVRRNKVAGVRTTSPGVLVSEVKADRNAIGFDVSGDGSELSDCRALRSEPIPNVGIHVHGVDVDGNDRVVRVNRCEVEGNVVGILATEGPQLLEDNDVRENVGDGIHVASTGSKVKSNSLKYNEGSGIVVLGDGNNITANRSDLNGAHGYVISGIGNDINNNGAGSLTDQGNLGHGFLFNGFDNIVESNDAEANLGDGFHVEEDTGNFKSNSANDNLGTGFKFTVGGNNLDTNVATDNGVYEFSIAPGNADDQGNRIDGATFSFGAGGGNF